MAAGKSTVAQALAMGVPHAFAGRVEYEAGDPGEGEAQLRLRHRLSAATAGAYAEAGFTAVVRDVVLGEGLTAREAGRESRATGLDGRGVGRGAVGRNTADRVAGGLLGADRGGDRRGDSGATGTCEGALSVY